MTPVTAESGSSTPVIVVSVDTLAQDNVKTDVAEQKVEDEAASNTESVEADAKNEADKEVKEVIKVGMECDLKHLYQKEDDKGRTSWTDKYPEDLEEAAENETTAKFAILVRNKKSFEDSRKKLEIDSIVVQSPLLKIVLAKVLKDYPGITCTLKRLVFQAPFNPFVHRWEELAAALDEEEDEETKKHLELLFAVLKVELTDIISARLDYIKNKVITFEHLWTIFVPGTTLYSAEWNRDCGSRFKSSSYFEHPKYGNCFGISAQKVDWDGDKFGYATAQNLILEFPGTMSISSLDTFPLEYHPEQEKVSSDLFKRGKLFESYHGYHYKSYKAFAIGKNKCGDDIKVTVDSRIVIDSFAFGKFNPNRIAPLAPLKPKVKVARESSNDYDDSDANSDVSYDSDDDDAYSFANDANSSNSRGFKHIPLTDAQLIQCTPLVRGYALKSKQWLSFFVDAVNEIEFNSSAFANLVLPADQKELILAFAMSQVKFKDDFDDVISGKGKGIIMLLSGGPGVGKTLTAESVAETMKVPLYMMSAGDLGIRSHEVEINITNILEMVAKWNAVLLLDECDVFLEARSKHDLERNKIVSIFLRTLEYYEGILFLTTNRVQDMDPAFQSRIHISMEYPGLDKEARKQVWQNFLKRGIENELSEKEVGMLAEVDINGRQIKNVLKTGQLLARHKGVKLRYEHLRTVLNVERKKVEQLA
ncbi:P-loop containing nucleoside triphosphate hydrolase protein [Hyaloscypha finlandica]|nr:P-loop containing nucleoside triphosphate hydrolase protein [Hyaloscypha finlandica]